MEEINTVSFIDEMCERIKKEERESFYPLGRSYELLYLFVKHKIVPIIRRNQCTISVVELTTCGLISDLLTSVSGASEFFIMGIVPYHNSSKIYLGIPEWMLNHKGPGTVSEETAYSLAKQIKTISKADIGIAETGLLASSSLSERKTQKNAGTSFLSIVSENKVFNQELIVSKKIERHLMRQELAFRILLSLERFLTQTLL